jgi:hypothetical protein
MMRFPTSASENRTYGAEKIRSSRYSDFFSRIAPKPTCRTRLSMSAYRMNLLQNSKMRASQSPAERREASIRRSNTLQRACGTLRVRIRINHVTPINLGSAHQRSGKFCSFAKKTEFCQTQDKTRPQKVRSGCLPLDPFAEIVPIRLAVRLKRFVCARCASNGHTNSRRGLVVSEP